MRSGRGWRCRIATRSDKTDQRFAATIHLAAIVMALK
jgi:hypothetical protein